MVSARVIEDPDGRQFAVVTFTDITEQKQAEERLREANRQLEERQREIEIELALAARVQQSLAPRSLRWGAVAVETFYQPARTIGGDFGLVASGGAGELHLLVCDVSGHGISSALIANRIYAETTALLEQGAEVDELFRRLNRLLREQIAVGSFFLTMALARLDDQGRLTFAGAGHPPAIRIAPDGQTQQLRSRNLPLGFLEQAVLEEPAETLQLHPGDRLALYSDGLTDVFDQRDEMLGVEGLEKIVRDAARQPLAQMKRTIIQKVEAWCHGPIADDLSLVLVEIL